MPFFVKFDADESIGAVAIVVDLDDDVIKNARIDCASLNERY